MISCFVRFTDASHFRRRTYRGDEAARNPNARFGNTGVGDKAGVVRLMRLGCRDFIDKPFSPDEIENRITSLLDALSSEVAENTRKEYMARQAEKANRRPMTSTMFWQGRDGIRRFGA